MNDWRQLLEASGVTAGSTVAALAALPELPPVAAGAGGLVVWAVVRGVAAVVGYVKAQGEVNARIVSALERIERRLGDPPQP